MDIEGLKAYRKDEALKNVGEKHKKMLSNRIVRKEEWKE